MFALARLRGKGSGAGMQFRGAASLADVPYWRKTYKLGISKQVKVYSSGVVFSRQTRAKNFIYLFCFQLYR
jgi:hypothetical protein